MKVSKSIRENFQKIIKEPTERGSMNQNVPGLKKDKKAKDEKANGVLNRTDKKTKINIQTANS